MKNKKKKSRDLTTNEKVFVTAVLAGLMVASIIYEDKVSKNKKK
jgi:hypothetical protein